MTERAEALKHKLKKLSLSESDERFFEAVTDYSMQIDRDKRFLKLQVRLTKIFPKAYIYKLEEAVKNAYELACARICPQYDSSLFTLEYLPEVLLEGRRLGSVVNGFFSDCTSKEEPDGSISISVPFSNGGMDLLELARSGEVFSDIIKNEFSIDIPVRVIQSADYKAVHDKYLSDKNEQLLAQAEAARQAMLEAAVREENLASENDEADADEQQLPRVTSLFEGESVIMREADGTVTSGKMRFDLSDAEQLYGEAFNAEEAVPLRALDSPRRNVITLGEIFSVDSRDTRKGDKTSITIGITDKDTSVFVKTVLGIDASQELLDDLGKGKGKPVAVKGHLKTDTFTGELQLQLVAMQKIRRVLRSDNADVKRVELHMHTNLSAMDATAMPADIVKTAHRFGHPAVAITDHGNLQGFPTAMLAAQEVGIKVLYGIEAYFVDDTAKAVYGEASGGFRDTEFVIFDIETTGLSNRSDRITEIGAVLVKDGKVLDTFNRLVNPQIPIPEKIVELTGINDDMVKDAPDISEVLPEFLEFAGDRLLIAHNADFDTGFIRIAADTLGIKFDNPYLDTLAMSRYVNPELKTHKLNILADYFKLGGFNHHRASDDAEMLAAVFYKMTDKLVEEGIFSLEGMLEAMSEKTDALKLPTYHQIILVKNKVGLKNLYELVSESYLKYYRKHPRIPKTRLIERREGLLIGSACEAGELFRAILKNRPEQEIENIVQFYDYLEIQPISNNRFMVEKGEVADDEGLRDLNRRIVELGKKYNKPVVATCDAHYIDEEDGIYRRILLAGMKFSDADRDSRLYFRTTEEMLEEFSYLGDEVCREVVINNPRMIADMIETIRPIPEGFFPPHIPGANEELREKCNKLARELYGSPLPPQVESRLERELNSIINNGFAIMYIIARKLVENSESKGYQVGSRGSVGSSFVATMAGITKVNPLPPHYRCPECRYSEFIEDGSVGSGFDLPPKNCPNCGTPLDRNGHDIPFETFLGFYGDKTPDIDLNFSGDVQGEAHKFTEVLFGEGKAFKAGTIGTLADKTAFGYVAKYLEGKGISVNRAEVDRLISGIAGTKRTTGQHPGGIIVVPRDYDITDFAPVQHPADDPNSDIITTHFEFKYLHDTLLKLDILGHDIPTKYKRLEEYTNTNILDVPMSDAQVYKLFTSTEPLGITPDQLFDCKTGTLGLPEMSTSFVRGVLVEAQPKTFTDLLQISGLTHGTNVWIGNADELIKNGTCTISDVIGTRDDIMLYLIHKHHIENKTSFDIMEKVRKGKGLSPEHEAVMREHDVPDWYIDSCKKIKYMFPKAHAAAYVIDALRLGYYKIYYPVQFYAAYFTAAPDGFDSELVMKGPRVVKDTLYMLSKIQGRSQKEAAMFSALQLVDECYARGFKFLPVDLHRSHGTKFIPEEKGIRLPFSSLPELGENAAINIMEACREHEIYSVDDLRLYSKASKTVIEILRRNGVLDTLDETNQITMGFGMGFAAASHTEKKTVKEQKPETGASDDSGEQMSMF